MKVQDSPQRLLLVKNRALGDALMGLGAVQALGAYYPETQLYYALPSWIVPVFKHFHDPQIKIIPITLKSAGDFFKQAWELRKSKFDAIYEMHQAGRTKKLFKLYQYTTGTPYGFHNHHLKSGQDVVDQGVIKPLIQRDLDGIFSYFTGTKEKIPSYLDWTPMFSLDEKPQRDKTLIIGVVATRETKMYPLPLYLEIIKRVKTQFPEWNIVIPLSTSEADLKIKSQLVELGFESYAQIVHYPLSELPLHFAKASLYLGNDTGLKHLAISLGVTTLTFFGPEPPLEWHPYDQEKHPYFYLEGLDCRTLTAHYCGLSVCDSMICLNQFSPENVFEKLRAYL